MSRFLEVMLKEDLRRLVKYYIEAFPYSYSAYNAGPADFQADLEIYEEVILSSVEDIFRLSAWGISGYSALYRVMPIDGIDEFKTIYFLGRAIERHLLKANFVKIAQIHMFTMIGLLDKKLLSKQIKKPVLTGAMTELIRLSRFDQELGATGCYLIYKCCSTVPRDMVA